MSNKDSLNYCIHCGEELSKNEIANATGFCANDKCQTAAGNI